MTDTLFLNAKVLTLDDANRVAEGVTVRDGRIRAVGSVAELRAAAAAGAREVDLGGQVLIPGIVDAHSHMVMVGELGCFNVDLNSPPIGDVKSMNDLVARLRARAESTPAGDWIVGRGYDDTLIAEGRHPTRHDLDRASTDRPIVASHISGHLLAANSRALEIAGVARDTPQPAGGVIRHDESGEPDGVFEEVAILQILAQVPALSEADRLSAIEWAAKLYGSRGITTAQNGLTDTQGIRDLDAAYAAGRIPVRTVAWPNIGVMRHLLDGSLVTQTAAERLTLGAIKLFADGSIQGYTGHLCEPYHVPFKGQGDYCGYAAMPPDQLAKQVTEIYAAGLQVAVHVNGDAAIDAFLDAVEHAQQAHPRSDARPIAVHAQMTREDQLDRMQQLGVVPSFFCLHTYYWGDRHRDIFIGPERARRISPTRSAADRGMRFTIHTDAPVVPMTPMLLVWSAANRRTTGGAELGPEQCLTPLEALRATTIDAAWQLRLEADRGSIEVGKLADFAVLDGDPLADPLALRDLQVSGTFVGGQPLA